MLSVPILMNIKGPARFFGYIGPRLDFELGSDNGVAKYDTGSTQIRKEDNLSDHSEFFVAGWSAGLGKRFNIGDIDPAISFRYSGDFSQLVRDDRFVDLHKRRFEVLVDIPL